MDEQQAFEKVLGHRRPTSLKTAEPQHLEPADGRPQQIAVADSKKTSTVEINEPTNTITAEVDRPDGPTVVASDNMNVY